MGTASIRCPVDQTDRYVFFKEVGLPTAGAFGLSEANQDLYYRGLARTDVHFAYFEASTSHPRPELPSSLIGGSSIPT